MSGVLIQARGLAWAVGDATIISGIDLDVQRGELVGVIGPNGAGKTTLLRLLAGVRVPTAGDVLLDGRKIGSMDSRGRARLVSFMTQDISQVFPFTVMEILLMGRYPHLGRFQRESIEDRERARRMLSYVGLPAVENREFSGLSGGERQLVLFARALVQETEALLLDEPSSNLDIRHEDQIFSMSQELAREGRAVIASVHNLSVAAQYCSRLVLLERGRIARDGPPEHVLKSEILDAVYGIRTMVSPSLATGGLTVSVVPRDPNARGTRVHLIGGAGSAVNLTRELFRLGCSITGGIAHEYDSDEKLWRSLGIRCATVGAFSRITDEQVHEAAPFVEQADITILCSFPIGVGNLGNLKLAARAGRLVVLKTGPEGVQRTFFSQEGSALFDQVCAGARVRDHAGIIADLVTARDDAAT